jgi:hypothetical protein
LLARVVEIPGDPHLRQIAEGEGEGKKKKVRQYVKSPDQERVYEFLVSPRTGQDSRRRTLEFPEVGAKGLHVQHVLQGIAAKTASSIPGRWRRR